jgi:hypothetical protein
MPMPALPAGHIPTAAELEQITDQVDLLSDPPRAQLRQTVAQAIGSGAFTALTFDSEDYDNRNGHSTSSNTSRYTCQVAGWYRLTGKIAFAGNTTGRRASKWQKNGSDISASQVAAIATSASDVEHPAATIEVLLAVNDYVELLAFQESGGSLNTFVGAAAQQPFMSVRRIGES